MPLQKLSPTTTRRLSSSQVISSIYDAVKELVENALDSGASAISVKLVNYGLERIEVQDDGSGVSSAEVEHMCLPHYTSKIKEFSDLGSKLETYGFRGEALASLCNVAMVEITTRTANDRFASCFTFDKNGMVLDSKPSHNKKGTTVVVSNIFSNLPVRRKFISSSNRAKTEFKKTEGMVKNFAIINSSVYFSFFHNKCMVWQKSPAQTLKESVKDVLGYTIANQLDEISSVKNKKSLLLVIPRKDCKEMASLCFTGVDVIRIFVNQRPVRYSKLQKILSNCISEYFGANYPHGKYPISVVSIKVAPCDVDVNIESNKTKVMCHDESDLLESIEEVLTSYYVRPKEQCVAKPSGVEEERNKPSCSLKSKQQMNDISEKTGHKFVVTHQASTDREVAEKETSQNPLPNQEKENRWASADSAMDSWSGARLNSVNINENTRLSAVEENSCNKSSENPTKRPHFEGNKEEQSILSGYNPSNEVFDLAVNEQKTSDCEIENTVVNPNSGMRRASSNQVNDLWASADMAMGLWSRGCTKLESGDVIENKRPAIEEKSRNKSSENPTKRPHLEGNKEDQSTQFVSKPSNEVFDVAVNQQTTSDCEIVNTVINPNSGMRCAAPNQVNDLWASADSAMGLWSRGCMTSESGDVIEGGARLLKPKYTNGNQESTRKAIEASTARSKLNVQTTKSNTSHPKILNSSFHSVSSQMGIKKNSAFINFCREMRPKILKEKPGLRFPEVARLISDYWKTLSTDEKNFYSKKIDDKKLDTSNKSQNRSLLQMFEKQSEKKLRKSFSWQVESNCWKIRKPEKLENQIKVQLTDNNLTSIKIELLHMLPKGIWICKRGEEIGVIHPWCLQETIMYKQLMESQSVPVILLDKPLMVKRDDFAPELWQNVTDLEVERINTDTFQVVSPIVIKNGFNLTWENGELYMTHVASTIRHYGIKELQEILTLRKTSSQLSRCRPVKVAAFFENEAVRYSSEKQSILDRKEMVNLLESWSISEDRICLHQKPIFKPLHILPKTIPPELSYL